MNLWLKMISLIVALLFNSPFHTANADEMTDVYDSVAPSIYQLFAVNKNKETIISAGSSVAISKHYLATNCHVALTGNFLIVKVNDNPFMARLCYFNQKEDLCIVDVTGVELSPARIRKTKDVKVGEDVYAVGRVGKSGKLMATHGIVEQIHHEAGYAILESNAKTTFGSSGGGLFDKNANLIGITTKGVPGTDTGFSISTELILEVVDPKHAPTCRLPP